MVRLGAALLVLLLCCDGALCFVAPASHLWVAPQRLLLASSDDTSAAGTPAAVEPEDAAIDEPTGPCPGFAQCNGEWRSKGCDGTGDNALHHYLRCANNHAHLDKNYRCCSRSADSAVLASLHADTTCTFARTLQAYRPCPSFQAAGYNYRRQGQSLNEVVFGSKAAGDDQTIFERFDQMQQEEKAQQQERKKQQPDSKEEE
ncbi:hypothetical protein JKP88DRAFT_253202 [Tribonema minus]|uniref:Uncharacterized protein n=1 Tax=Tribonema minus TaxID=303371 RepID=A0A835Z981_9STRA|nr:hypothetical protein JKP88DRAFT_253202 [Tribonema minus]